MASLAEILAAKKAAALEVQRQEEAQQVQAEKELLAWQERHTVEGYLKGERLSTGFPLEILLHFYDVTPILKRGFDGEFYFLDALVHWLGPFNYKEVRTRKVPASQWNWGLARIASLTGIPEETVHAVAYQRWIEPLKRGD